MAKNDTQALKQARKIIERFGGIRPMAAKIDVPVTTVQGWKKRDVIPGRRRALIIQAAEQNNIDLDGLMDGSQQHTETSDPKVQAVQGNVQPVETSPTYEKPSQNHSKQKHSEHKHSKHGENHDTILAAMEETRQKTVVQSVWLATGLILLAAIVAAFLLWPSAKEVEQQTEKLVELEEEVDEVKEETSFLKKMIPSDIKNKVDDLQNQARTLQDNVQDLTKRADTIAGDILGPDGGPLSERLMNLEQQMGSLSENANFGGLLSRIESLENSVDGQAQLQASMEELRHMMTNLGGANNEDALTQNLAEAQSSEEGALGQTLEGVNGTDLKAAAMLIAFSQLRKSLYRQESFDDDLSVLQKLAGEDNAELQGAISRLAPHANSGVLTPAGLSQEFKGLAGDIVFSSIKGEDVSFKDKFKARLNNVLQVEKDGELITGTPTQATVNQAQQMLDAGNVQGAITHLQTLEGPAAQTAQPFIEQAQVSLLAKQVEQMLGSSILSKITGQLPIQDILNGAMGGAGGNIPTNLPQIPGMTGTGFPNAAAPGLSPAPLGGNAAPFHIPSGQMPGQANGQINMNDIKETLEDTLQPAEVISDEESGIRILPNQSGFKGFSAGDKAAPLAP